MKYYTTIRFSYNKEYKQVFPNLLDAAFFYCEEHNINANDVLSGATTDKDISVSIIAGENDYFYSVDKENEGTNCGTLSAILNGDTEEEELKNIFDSENWTENKDIEDIDVEFEEPTIYQCRNASNEFFFVSGGYYTFCDYAPNLQAILIEGACYDDKITLADIMLWEKECIEVSENAVRDFIKSQVSETEWFSEEPEEAKDLVFNQENSLDTGKYNCDLDFIAYNKKWEKVVKIGNVAASEYWGYIERW